MEVISGNILEDSMLSTADALCIPTSLFVKRDGNAILLIPYGVCEKCPGLSTAVGKRFLQGHFVSAARTPQGIYVVPFPVKPRNDICSIACENVEPAFRKDFKRARRCLDGLVKST
jgi:hypothetical protein